MRSEWEEVRLGNITTKIGSGATPRGGSQVYSDAGVAFIRSQNVLDYDFSIDGLVFINDEHAKQLGNVAVHENDIMLNITGDSVARACLVPTDMLPARVNQHVSIIRVNPSIADHKYILYQLQNLKDLLLSYSHSGATRKALTKSMLENLEITLPTLSEQKAISDILACLDSKIELNNKINENLEAQAQAIFKSWFVDFEPFGGVRPSDWEVRRLGEYFPVITGKMNANVASDTGSYPFFSCSQSVGLTDQYSFDAKAVLVAGNGGFNVKWYDGKFEAYQRTYVLIPHDGRLLGFLYYATRTGLADITSGARGSVIRFITKGSIENHEITVPINLAELPVVQTLQRMNEQIAHRDKESKALAALRDTLLPKLMSGEIEVPID